MRDDRGLWPALLLMAMAMAMGEADLQLHASIFLARGYLGLLGHMLSSTSITADPLRVLLLGVRRVWMHDASPFFPFESLTLHCAEHGCILKKKRVTMF
jgi:hypothetical protein